MRRENKNTLNKALQRIIRDCNAAALNKALHVIILKLDLGNDIKGRRFSA